VQHSACGLLEAPEFTSVNSSPAPATLQDILRELEVAEKDDALRVPELNFVREVLQSVGSIDVSGLSDGTDAPMHRGVNKMFEARDRFEREAALAVKMTEAEAALHALMVSQSMSQGHREEWCKFMSERKFISPGLPGRMSAENNIDLVPEFKEASLCRNPEDASAFGDLTLLYRDIVEVVWSILCNPAFSLDQDLAAEFEEVFDEESEATNDPLRGSSFPDVNNALWFKVLRLRLPNSVLPIAVFLASDATNLVNVGTKSGHGLYVAVVNLRAHARKMPYAIKLLALYMPPKHGAGVSPAVADAYRTRYDEYLQQARDHIYQPLREVAEHGIRLPLPMKGPSSEWDWVTCFIVIMGEGGDLPERYHLSCCVCGTNAAFPCPKCQTEGGSALREPVEATPFETTALKSRPRRPREPDRINKTVALSQMFPSKTARKQMLRTYGARGVPLLTNIPGFNPILSLLCDVMHTLEGVTKRLLEGAILAVSAPLRPAQAALRVAELNYRLQVCRAFCGPRGEGRLPPINLFQFKSKTGAGLRSQFTAKEFSAACPHLPLVFAPWPQLSKLFQAWALLYVALRSPMPTWATLRRIYILYQHFLNAFDNSTLGAHLKEGIDTPKVHDILHIVGQMICYGCADVASLQQMENAHITWLKRTFKATDMRAVGFEKCMARRIILLETERLAKQLTAGHYAQNPPPELPRSAVDTWRDHAGMPRIMPPCSACTVALNTAEADGATTVPATLQQCRADCARARLRRSLRGEGRRQDLPSAMSLRQLAASSCATPVGDCDLEGIAELITAALDKYPDVLHLAGDAMAVDLDARVVPYTAARVRGAGRESCVEAWAMARPARRGRGSAPTFDFVALADHTQTGPSGKAGVDEAYGLVALIFTCSSVDQPLALLKMLRRAPLGTHQRYPLEPPIASPRLERQPVAPPPLRRWVDAEAVDVVVRETATHGGLGPLCSWEMTRAAAYRIVPVASLLRVCAVAPYLPFYEHVPTPRLRAHTDVEWWYVCPYQRELAGPARGRDWRQGVAAHARRRPQPVLEERCAHCLGLENTANNPMYTCENEPERCLVGWHKQCLIDRRLPVPRARQRFYCQHHRPAPP